MNDHDFAALAFLPAHALAACIRDVGITASALVEGYLQRIAAHDQKLHAFVAVHADEARAAAERADAARRDGTATGPLHGVPIALKDLLEVAGHPTTMGSLFWRERQSRVTAAAVRRLTAAGMIVLGKTHLVEFAFGSWGTNTTMGTPWNPWDATVQRTPGGSSSGSAVAVAAALAPAAIGSDTGGSIRAPAALCGIVGLKTTVGRISTESALPLSATLDTLGPMTRDVEDAALLLSVMDDRQTDQRDGDVLRTLRDGVAGSRIGVLSDEAIGDCSAEVRSAMDVAVNTLRTLGAQIETLRLPADLQTMANRVGALIAAEGYAVHREWIGRDDLPFDPDVRARLRMGHSYAPADVAQLTQERHRIQADVEAALTPFDAWITPTTPLPAIPLTKVDQQQAPMSRLTRPINYLGGCAIAVPCGFTTDGLPLSLQIAGRPFAEANILRIAWAYEQATQWHRRRPPLPA